MPIEDIPIFWLSHAVTVNETELPVSPKHQQAIYSLHFPNHVTHCPLTADIPPVVKAISQSTFVPYHRTSDQLHLNMSLNARTFLNYPPAQAHEIPYRAKPVAKNPVVQGLPLHYLANV